jgi:hypothetical protein
MASFSHEQNFDYHVATKRQVTELFREYRRDRYVPLHERMSPKVKRDPVQEAIAACDIHDAGRYGLRFNGLPALVLGFANKIRESVVSDIRRATDIMATLPPHSL